MKKIQVLDRTFRLYMSAEEIDQAVKQVAARISADYKDKDSESFGNMGDIFGNIKL